MSWVCSFQLQSFEVLWFRDERDLLWYGEAWCGVFYYGRLLVRVLLSTITPHHYFFLCFNTLSALIPPPLLLLLLRLLNYLLLMFWGALSWLCATFGPGC